MSKPRIGLALGMGGARGWCHIGVIRGLEEMGIRPDVIAGSSMGAAVGAIYAGGMLDELETFARSLNRQRLLRLLDLRLAGGGLIEGSGLVRVMRDLDIPDRFEDLAIPLTVVASNMRTGREVWLGQGDLAGAVRASAAMPGVLSPHRVDGVWYLDGGLTNPVPVSVCRAMGAEIVIAVNPIAKLDGTLWRGRPRQDWGPVFSGWREWLPVLPDILGGGEAVASPAVKADSEPSYFEVISVALDIMTEQILRSRLAGDPPHVLLSADLSEKMTVMDFDRASEAIDEGRRIVEAQRTAIEAVMRA